MWTIATECCNEEDIKENKGFLLVSTPDNSNVVVALTVKKEKKKRVHFYTETLKQNSLTALIQPC